jgi:hypothetical protein
MSRDNPALEYTVLICATCGHPGGQHLMAGCCRLCPDCPGWDDATAKRGWWSDMKTAQAESASGIIGEGGDEDG